MLVQLIVIDVGGDLGSEVLDTITGDNNSDFRNGGVDDRVDVGEDG